ncbi:hypothetical protein ERIC1_1c14790 [Paenibacillus larvae subsp. larvae DSM 25719]|uniref:Uncharacterized protein n=1 Tax=Paenibacillus phage Tripp TaxID=1718161 RepID=A0A0N9SJV6_9CAUD|nr:hypothetical protein TRIPP_46 [Paenibacillus phage Tripp]ALH46419.1 hypothetical protein TRIPP_46 [Paenibacillus phage Tripp]ETK28024.1 hypothetical protein ERIC1_1c14790 [Paenibacillus larvae subsp. larvae DSM 25719]
MEDIWDVDDWVEEVARSSYREFCLENVEANVNLPSPEILNRLLLLVEDGKLETWFVVKCPVCSSKDVTYPLVVGVRKICGDHEFDVSLDNTYLLFRVTAYYKDQVQKQSENHRGIRRFIHR